MTRPAWQSGKPESAQQPKGRGLRLSWASFCTRDALIRSATRSSLLPRRKAEAICVGQTISRSSWGRDRGSSRAVRKVAPALPPAAWLPFYPPSATEQLLQLPGGAACGGAADPRVQPRPPERGAGIHGTEESALRKPRATTRATTAKARQGARAATSLQLQPAGCITERGHSI